MLNIVLFGPPGAGKGTQSQKLIDKYDLVHLSTGDMLRSEVAAGTPTGMEVKSLMDKGILVSDELVISMISARIDKFSYANGFIFDGFPRTAAQAKALDELLASKGTSITLMLELAVDEDELIRRLMKRAQEEGRTDDQDESVVRNRINEYNAKTAPLKDYYSAQGKYFAVKGVGSIDDIFNSLCKVIEENYKAVTPKEKEAKLQEEYKEEPVTKPVKPAPVKTAAPKKVTAVKPVKKPGVKKPAKKTAARKPAKKVAARSGGVLRTKPAKKKPPRKVAARKPAKKKPSPKRAPARSGGVLRAKPAKKQRSAGKKAPVKKRTGGKKNVKRSASRKPRTLKRKAGKKTLKKKSKR